RQIDHTNMITFFVTERFSSTIRKLLSEHKDALKRRASWLSYEELFFERAGPVGHVVFTDIDRLSRYELESAAIYVAALRAAAPSVRVLNNPLLVRERLPLLAALHRAGLNDFEALRLDTGARPSAFPVFIRAEDSHLGPETDLLRDENELTDALA